MPSGDERSSRVYKRSKSFQSAQRLLGKQIRALRQNRGWTLENAAAEMQLDLKHLQKIEAGQLNVTLVTLVRIADGLQVPLSELFPQNWPKN